MTDTELISAIHTAVKESEESLRKEIKATVSEGTKDLKKQLDNLEKKVQKMDTKFGVQLGQIRCQIGDMQEDINYLKQQPSYVDSRLNFLESAQEITDKRLDILEAKQA